EIAVLVWQIDGRNRAPRREVRQVGRNHRRLGNHTSYDMAQTAASAGEERRAGAIHGRCRLADKPTIEFGGVICYGSQRAPSCWQTITGRELRTAINIGQQY